MKRNILFSTSQWQTQLSREKTERMAADNSKEESANKVSVLRENPDNTHYPSEKLMHDCLAGITAGKADKNGIYPELTAGNTLNLTCKETIASQFTHRPTGGDTPVADGQAHIKSIKGNSILWNQYALVAETALRDNVSIQSLGDGSYTLQTAVDETAANDIIYRISESLSGCAGHKILFFGAPKGSSPGTYCLYAEKSNLRDTGDGCIIESAQVGETFAIKVTKDTMIAGKARFVPQIFDLTKMFGSGNEPTTIEEFRALFPLPYYEYNSGRLLSMKATDIKTTEFNQFNGRHAAVLAHHRYYLIGTYRSFGFSQDRNGTITELETPLDRIFIPDTNGYIHATGEDICINLSHEERNGEYEDYTENIHPLPTIAHFPDGMKSIGDVCDEITEEKIIKRIATRAYKSGDESNSSLLTDGVETYYILAAPVITAATTTLNLSYKISSYGTEEVIYETHSAPMKTEIVYPLNAKESIKDNRRKIAELSARLTALEAQLAK